MENRGKNSVSHVGGRIRKETSVVCVCPGEVKRFPPLDCGSNDFLTRCVCGVCVRVIVRDLGLNNAKTRVHGSVFGEEKGVPKF